MQGFTPPEELLDAQAGNRGTLIEHQHRLLLKSQTAAEIDSSFMGIQIWILIRKSLCRHILAGTDNE
jgi:hypothetical protein